VFGKWYSTAVFKLTPESNLANFKRRGGDENLSSCQKIPEEVKDASQDFFLKPYQTRLWKEVF
jgi:hypothetical protein